MKSIAIKLNLRNGDIINGKASLNELQLNTAWGNLQLTVKDISQIVFGILEDKSQDTVIETLVHELAENDYDRQNNAYQKILSLPVSSIASLEKMIEKDSFASLIFTDFLPENIVDELRAIHGIPFETKKHDVVTIDGEYTIPGEIQLDKIEITTDFGSLSIPRDKINSIEIFIDSEGITSKSFKLSGNMHISGNTAGGWLKTGITLKVGQKFSISANGEIVLASLSNQKYKPDGSYYTTTGSLTPGSTDPNIMAYGNVIFKIGENGIQTRAGAKYSSKATTAGMLYISVYETVYNNANTGHYNAQVRLG
jgi:hypothetical protein